VTTPAIVLHGTALSGHTRRVQHLLHVLELPYRFADSPSSVRATPAFRALNPFGQIPVLEDGDLACHPYVAHAPEGGVTLEPFPAVRAWIERVEALPRFQPMPRSAVTAERAGART
jgi:glutathione S-transferase